MKEIKIGLVGAGVIGKKHALAIKTQQTVGYQQLLM